MNAIHHTHSFVHLYLHSCSFELVFIDHLLDIYIKQHSEFAFLNTKWFNTVFESISVLNQYANYI